MLIIGCDYHPSVQQIAWADTETGECGEKRLIHSDGGVERFYRELKQRLESGPTRQALSSGFCSAVVATRSGRSKLTLFGVRTSR